MTTPASAALQWLMTTSAALASATPDGVVEAATPMFAAALGTTPDRLVGITLADVLAPDEAPEFAARLGEVATFDTTTGAVGPGGSVTVSGWVDGALPFRARFELSSIPGGGAAILAATRVNPELVPAAAGHRDPRATFESEISGALSHDVRASLRSVNGFLGLVGRSDVVRKDETAAKHLRTSRDAGTTADQGVEAIVRLMRIRERALLVREVPLAGVIDKGRQHTTEILPGLAPAIDVDGIDHLVLGDPLLIGELLGELFTNARKFGGEQVRISVRARREGRWLYVEVRDSGPGVAPELAADAFRLFRLLQPKGRFPGVGMGLPLVRVIAEAHAGTVEIEPRAGEGTVVRLRLPAGVGPTNGSGSA